MLTGEPDAGNPHVRFDEGEWQEGLASQAPPVTLYSTGPAEPRDSVKKTSTAGTAHLR
jgi:hypothetical protein